MADKNIFLSYSWSNFDIADKVDDRFKAVGISLIRDTRDAPYKTDLKEFMRQARNTDFVLMMISDEFLKSENCMYEVMELMNDRGFRQRILQIIIDNAKIFDPNYRLSIVRYWKDKTIQLRINVDEVGAEYVGLEINTLKHYDNISRNISDFLGIIATDKSLLYHDLLNEQFKPIFNFIGIKADDLHREIIKLADVKDDAERNNQLLKLSLDPNFQNNYLIYFANGYFEQDLNLKVTYYDKAINLNPQNAEAYNNRGNAYSDLTQFKRAIEDYDQAIRLNPQDAEAYYNRGIAYRDLTQFKRAIEDYDQAIKLNPQDAEAYYNRGNAYCDLTQFKRAIEDYDKAIKLNPKNVGAYNNRGVAYCDLTQFKRAIEDYDKAINLNPQDAEAYCNRGNAYRYLTQFKRAIEDYDQAIKLNPQNAEAYNNRGVAYRDLTQFKRAIEDYDQAIKLNPKNVGAYNNRGVAYCDLTQFKRAIEDYEKAAALLIDTHDPEHPHYLMAISKLNKVKEQLKDEQE